MSYGQICETLGESVVNSLIEYNIINLRPTSSFSHDLPMYDTPIITAESPASLVAMEELISEI